MVARIGVAAGLGCSSVLPLVVNGGVDVYTLLCHNYYTQQSVHVN